MDDVDPKELVRRGYDVVSEAYRSDDDADLQYEEWLTELASLLAPDGRVLDLGCGCGIPTARWLVERGFQVLGVDISQVQIRRARILVPEASFECSDMTSLDLPEGDLDAVVALYSIIHVPIEEQPLLLRKVRSWLRPGGVLLAIVGVREWTGTEENWLGATMYWSHADRETYLEWLAGAGFEVQWHRFIPEGDGGHTLVLARAVT